MTPDQTASLASIVQTLGVVGLCSPLGSLPLLLTVTAATTALVPSLSRTAIDARIEVRRPSCCRHEQLLWMGQVVIPRAHHDEVLGPVIGLVAIPVMDMLSAGQRPPQHLLGYDAMFVSVAVNRIPETDVAIRFDSPASLPPESVRSLPATSEAFGRTGTRAKPLLVRRQSLAAGLARPHGNKSTRPSVWP